MDGSSVKRKATVDAESRAPKKKHKGRKQWSVPRRQRDTTAQQQTRAQIEPGDAGLWATCTLNSESKAVGELRIVLEEYAQHLYGPNPNASLTESGRNSNADVEAEIAKELQDIHRPAMEPFCQNIKLDTPCLIFFKTRSPVVPTELVRVICEDAAQNPKRKQSRSVKRLTPATLIGKATEKGLQEVAQQVLAPHFHQGGTAGKSFAIRPHLRNHTVLTRDQVIKTVASEVGPGHKVDLTNPDRIILVDIYKNICGMSVVSSDYEKLRRYNLSEIHGAIATSSEAELDGRKDR